LINLRAWKNPLVFSYSLFILSDGAIITTWWYFNIFSQGLWMACLVSVVCATCGIMGVQYVRKKSMCANERDYDDELSSPFFDILYVFGGVTGQGNARTESGNRDSST